MKKPTYLLQINFDGDHCWETIKATNDKNVAYMHSISSAHRVVCKKSGKLITTKELL